MSRDWDETLTWHNYNESNWYGNNLIFRTRIERLKETSKISSIEFYFCFFISRRFSIFFDSSNLRVETRSKRALYETKIAQEGEEEARNRRGRERERGEKNNGKLERSRIMRGELKLRESIYSGWNINKSQAWNFSRDKRTKEMGGVKERGRGKEKNENY